MMTQKLSWSAVNFFPHHSFHWQGTDGAQILVHTLPEETYNSPALPRAVRKIDQNYREAGVSEHALMLFGIGDGGGGPGVEHLERLRRVQNLSGLCPVKQETAKEFFGKWAAQSDAFPTWVGELYLEKHQGTFTTNAKTKLGNRRMEQGLRELEFTSVLNMFSSAAAGGGGGSSTYPVADLDRLWKETLLYQFHDILPGSSIKRVYDECEVRYDAMLKELEELIATQQQSIVGPIAAGVSSQSAAAVSLFNSLSWERGQWIFANGQWIFANAAPLSASVIELGGSATLLAAAACTLSSSAQSIENDLLRVRFDGDGAIVSIFDKEHQREVLAPGTRANRLRVYYDPGDPWDFPLDYADQSPRYMQLANAEDVVDGPRVEMRQQYTLGMHTTLSQTVVLTAGSRRLDFATTSHWRGENLGNTQPQLDYHGHL